MTATSTIATWNCNAVPPSMKQSWLGKFKNALYMEPAADSGSIFTKGSKAIEGMFKLIPEQGKTGMNLVETKLHNMCVAYWNPFAFVEYMCNRK